jgi:hypothetical protein
VIHCGDGKGYQSASRRQQILKGAWSERAQFQFELQDQNAVPAVPIRLDLRLNLKWLIPNLIIVLLCFGCIFWLLWTIYSTWSTLLNDINSQGYMTMTTNIPLVVWFMYAILALVWWAIWIFLAVFVRLRLQRWLSPGLLATEEGLTAFYPNKEVTIQWSNVRYFALVKKYKSSPEPKNWTYEISDGEQIIRWQQPYVAKRIYPLYVPVLPQDLYEKEFANLLSIISAHTGRPLLDMHLR